MSKAATGRPRRRRACRRPTCCWGTGDLHILALTRRPRDVTTDDVTMHCVTDDGIEHGDT